MSDYNLVTPGTERWLTPEDLTSALTEAFPGTSFESDLVPEGPMALWAYVPDGEGRTGEVTLNKRGTMVSFTDTTRERVAEVTVTLARRHPHAGLQLWRWTETPVDVTPETEPTDLLSTTD